MAMFNGRKCAADENPSVFSRASDIAFWMVTVIVAGLMVQGTASLASQFVILQYGRDTVDRNEDASRTYDTGPKDLLAVFFFFLICILFHDFLQDFVLEKICCKLRVSKWENFYFKESGQLVVFSAISLIWALDILIRENWCGQFYKSPSLIGYTDDSLSFSTKFFYIIQFAYWAHTVPELYFQKDKLTDMNDRVQSSVTCLAFVTFMYISNFYHVGVVYLLLQSTFAFIKHTVELISITEEDIKSKKVQRAQYLCKLLLPIVNLLTMVLSQIMIHFRLQSVEYTGMFQVFNSSTNKFKFSVIVAFIHLWFLYCDFRYIQCVNNIDFDRIFQNLKLAGEKLNSAANKESIKMAETSRKVKKSKKKCKKYYIILIVD